MVAKPKIERRIRPEVLLGLSSERSLRAISQLAREWGWKLLDINTVASGLIPLRPHAVGAILSFLPTSPQVGKLRARGIPVVRFGALPHPGDNRIPAVLPDQAAAGRLAADYYSDRNFKQVAFVGFAPLDPGAKTHALYRGFEQQAEARGMTCHLHQMKSSSEAGSTETKEARFARKDKALGKWLIALPKPVGVFTYSDYLAARLAHICAHVGLDMPEQVALLGLGNHEVACEMAPVELSSIDPAIDEQGRRAAILLQHLLKGGAAPLEPVWVPPRGVVTRRSTDLLAIPDPAVARAVRFIWDHLDQPLLVEDIARAAGVTRRKLERAFRIHLGRGINAELNRKRLERVRELLETTPLPVAAIARMAGFRIQGYLNLRFRKVFGVTTSAYRRKKLSTAFA